VNISRPEEFAEVVKAEPPKSYYYSYLVEWLGYGLLTNGGEDWKKKRRLLTPAFHFDVLKEYVPIFSKNTKNLLNCWQSEKDNEFDMQNEMSFVTLDNIGETAFGISFGAISNRQSDVVEATMETTKRMTERFSNPLYDIDFIYKRSELFRVLHKNIKILNDWSKLSIEKRKKEIASSTDYRAKYFIDILLSSVDEDGKHLTEQEMLDEANTFMFEGHDTTSSGLMWTLYLIGKHPEVEKKVFEEVDRVLGDTEEPTWEQITQLHYLNQVIKESHRLLPPVPGVGRSLENDLYVSGYLIPAGTVITLSPLSIHCNPDVWEDPMRFDPERFSTQNMQNRHPYAYVPFSAGSRNCIGQKFAELEEKVVLSMIYHKYQVRHSGTEILPHLDAVLRNFGPLLMKITPRA